jgi:hypothetical protein
MFGVDRPCVLCDGDQTSRVKHLEMSPGQASEAKLIWPVVADFLELN